MAVNEQIVTGRKFRKLVDEATKLWQRVSFWHKASDCEFDDGKDAETKLGAIDGITDSLVSTSSRIAASAKAVNTLSNNLVSNIYVGTDGKLHKVQGGADTVLPFSGLKLIWSGQLSITSKAGSINHSGSVNTNHLGIKNAVVVITYFAASDNFTFDNNLKYNPDNGIITMNITSIGTPASTRTILFKLNLYGT